MNRHRSFKEAKRFCEQWQQSGLSQAEFCRQHNINSKTFSVWLFKIRSSGVNGAATVVAKNKTESAKIKFLQVNNTDLNRSNLNQGVITKNCSKIQKSVIVSQSEVSTTKNLLEITLPSGINIRASISQNDINGLLQGLLKWK